MTLTLISLRRKCERRWLGMALRCHSSEYRYLKMTEVAPGDKYMSVCALFRFSCSSNHPEGPCIKNATVGAQARIMYTCAFVIQSNMLRLHFKHRNEVHPRFRILLVAMKIIGSPAIPLIMYNEDLDRNTIRGLTSLLLASSLPLLL